MATGGLGQAGQTAREPVTVEHVYVIDFVTVHPLCMEERSVKEKDFWKRLATRNPVLVSIYQTNLNSQFQLKIWPK